MDALGSLGGMPDSELERFRSAANADMPRRGMERLLAAAVVALALLGGAWLGASRPVPTHRGEEALEIRLAAARSEMTEARFLEITRELLEADHRYRRVMLQILDEIESQVALSSGVEASGEESIGRSEESREGSRPRV